MLEREWAKQVLASAWVVAAAVLHVACEAPRTPAPLNADARAAAINARVGVMRLDTATVLELSHEGATLEAAYDSAHLRRLRGEFLGLMGRVTETFYFDSTLFLVIRRHESYDTPMSGRVIDSTLSRYDLTRPEASRTQVDSLAASATVLLQHLRRP
jgi:hypothetical protein